MKRKKIIIFSFILISVIFLIALAVFAIPEQTTAQLSSLFIKPFGGRVTITNIPPLIQCGLSTEVFLILPAGISSAGPFVALPSTKRYGIWSQFFGVAPLPPRAIKGLYTPFAIPCFTNTAPPAPAPPPFTTAFPIILFGTSLF
ncbi:MAG: hypothetical protein QMD65_00300 [Patescibacteria group bacterium]|nr:hypothetical protein [Patescibacteria group bacterium]